jgi:hypothetical protein
MFPLTPCFLFPSFEIPPHAPLDISLRRAALYPAELRVHDGKPPGARPLQQDGVVLNPESATGHWPES